MIPINKITVTISSDAGQSSILTVPSDLPFSDITTFVQSALDKCSDSVRWQKAWADDIVATDASFSDLGDLGKLGAVDGTVVFSPTSKVDISDLYAVKELIDDERSVVEIGSFKLEAWNDKGDFFKALSLAALIACYEDVMLIVRYPRGFEIGDDKYCPAPGIVRDLWNIMKGLAK